MINWLHVYAQEEQHESVWLVGDREALRNIRDAIDDVLSIPCTRDRNTLCADGEGYRVRVRLMTEEEMGALVLPYTDHVARGVGGKHPAELEAKP